MWPFKSRKTQPRVLTGSPLWARCYYCQRTDFIANMEHVWVGLYSSDYAHGECRRKHYGMMICPTCGTGEVPIPASKSKSKKP
jgi:hypothetical protein